MVAYRVGKIEIRDLSKAKPSGEEPDEPLAAFDFRDMNDEALANIRDLDCKNRDESQILVIFDSSKLAYLDLKTGQCTTELFTPQLLIYGTEGPKAVRLLQNIPGKDFMILNEAVISQSLGHLHAKLKVGSAASFQLREEDESEGVHMNAKFARE